MKKKVLMLLVVCVLVVSMSGCMPGTKTTQSKTGTESTTSTISSGTYFLFETMNRDEYFSFLENFDESKYEIVDISVTNRSYNTSEYINHYAITYKVAEEKWYENIIK